MRSPRGWAQGAALLAAALLLFSASLLLAERRLQEVITSAVATDVEAAWALFETRLAVEALWGKLETAGLPGRATPERLQAGLDRLDQAVDALAAVGEGGSVEEMPAAREAIARLDGLAARHRDRLESDPWAVAALRAELEPARGTLRELARALVDRTAAAQDELQRRVGALRRASWIALAGLLASTGILIFLLHREVGTTRRLLERSEEDRRRIEHLAHHDALTGLPNRRLFEDRLEQALALAKRTRRQLALLYLDLDRFKEINDTLGHRAGDELLRAMGDRLRRLLRGADTLARLGGDEFAVLQTEVKAPTDAAVLAERLMAGAAAPFRVAGQEVEVGTSVGIALFPGDGETTDALQANADLALYSAKAEGRGRYAFYRPELTEEARGRRLLARELGQGIAGGELELHYQPKVAAADGVVTGLEALVRWRHPERGMLSPGLFLPLAEETGLIEPLGAWVLADACRQIGRWRAGGLALPRVAVNLSPSQLRLGTVAQRLGELIAALDIPSGLLELELTEHVLLDDDPRVHRELEELNRLGVAIALDDFGTGYSCLSYLHRLHLRTLKIDRGLVKRFGDGRAETICDHVVRLAHDLGIVVVAEGIETRRHLEIARSLGFDELQGYWFSPPAPAAELVERLGRPGPFPARGETGA